MNSGKNHKIKLLLISGVLIFVFSCTKNGKNDTLSYEEEIFETFWNDFDLNYSGFELANVSWDSLYNLKRPLVNEYTLELELFQILKSMLMCLKDGHTPLYAGWIGNYIYYNTLVNSKPTNFINRQALKSKYLSDYYSNEKNFIHGKIKDENIGYFAVQSFGGQEENYYIIDSFLSKYRNSEGIILDARNNSGGNENHAGIISSRFTEQPVIYRYTKRRDSSYLKGFSDFIPLTLDPDGKFQYLGKVILLTNRRTFSAAEDFTLMLTSLPNTIHIGDTTFGAAGGRPEYKKLPNGWTYAIPRNISYDLNYKTFYEGIVPDINVQISEADSIINLDRILEKAIKIITEE